MNNVDANVEQVGRAIQVTVDTLHENGQDIFMIGGALIGGGVELFLRNGMPMPAVRAAVTQILDQVGALIQSQERT